MHRRLTGLGPLALAIVILLCPSPGSARDFAVDPRPAVATRDPRFGIVQAIHAPDWAVAAGATWERIIFPWSRMEPRPGVFEFDRGYFTEKQIRDQVARGFTEVGVIIYTPDWAAPDPKWPHPKRVPKNVYLAWDDPENYWARFVGKLADRYKGHVDHWVIWNEPDLYDPSSRHFFDGSFEDYYQLLKVAYQAIKANNPRAKVIIGGMMYWYDRVFDRPPYLASLLEVAVRDPTAKQNNWYFDIAAVHTYANPLNSYTQPMIMRRILEERGIVKPIWIMESNAVPGDDPKARATPGSFRASQDEQASYIIQSYALAIAAGVERQSVYKMLDEIPEDGQYFGLLRNDGTPRPAYVAFQVAATYLNNARWAAYYWSGGGSPPTDDEITALLASNRDRTQFQWPGQVNRVVVERGDRRTMVVWNASPEPVRARVPAAAPVGLGVTQYGDVGQVVARNGFYTLDLEPTVHNADPNDRSVFLIGGRPWIIEEQVVPLPERVTTRVQNLWPHNNAPVEVADRANITANVLLSDGTTPVPCRWEPLVLLWGSLNDGHAEVVGVGRREMMRGEGGVTYPAWQFDNVLVGPARFGNWIRFHVTVDGVRVTPEQWVYGGEHPTPLEPLPTPTVSCR